MMARHTQDCQGTGYRRRRRRGSRRPEDHLALRLVGLIVIVALALAGSSTVEALEERPRNDAFVETLNLKPLADGRLYSFFAFDLHAADRQSTPHRGQDKDSSHGTGAEIFGIVPRSLVHLARASDAQEIHLAINAGRWDYRTWGMPDGDEMVGTGAELRARVGHGPNQGSLRSNNSIAPPTLANWQRLTADLAGLFCASLNALDEKLTVEPFDADPSQPARDTDGYMTLRASLASESICTENLSTLLKLLPCKTLTGLASLLEPHHFFMSDFHGMALHLVKENGGWHVRINVQAVFSPVLQIGLRKNRDWSLRDIFGRRLVQSCPLVQQSSITVHAPPGGVSAKDVNEDNVDFGLWPIVMTPEQSHDIDEDDDLTANEKLLAKGRRFSANIRRQGQYTYDTMRSTDLDVQMVWPGQSTFHFPHHYDEPLLTASRIFSGYGQERGIIEVTIHNKESTRARHVMYEEVLPWFTKPYLHTLHAKTIADDYDEGQDDVVRYADDVTLPPLLSLDYTPSIARARPFHLRATLRVPPQSTVRLSYQYDKAFLRYAEHPPDAHRGFDIAPAIITLLEGSDDNGGSQERYRPPVRLYTESALVEVAVPDFSMPYNVIIFTSTLIALCAGSTLNNLVRKYTDILDVAEDKPSK